MKVKTNSRKHEYERDEPKTAAGELEDKMASLKITEEAAISKQKLKGLLDEALVGLDSDEEQEFNPFKNKTSKVFSD